MVNVFKAIVYNLAMVFDLETHEGMLEGLMQLYRTCPVDEIEKIDNYGIWDHFALKLNRFVVELSGASSRGHVCSLEVKREDAVFKDKPLFFSQDDSLEALFKDIDERVRQVNAKNEPHKDDATKFREILTARLLRA